MIFLSKLFKGYSEVKDDLIKLRVILLIFK